MEMYLECAICIQKQALQIGRIATNNERELERILRRTMQFVMEEDWHKSPLEMGRSVQDIIAEITGIEDPYKELKRQSNEAALKLIPKVKEKMKKVDDPLKIAIKAAIAGNIMDFGALASFDIERTLEDVLNEEMELKDYKLLKEKLKSAKVLTYIADNAGEIVFDSVLLEEIAKLKNIEKVIIVVRDRPLINDVTTDDLKYTGIDTLPKVEVATLHIEDKRAIQEATQRIENSDIVISKGQGNYEMFSTLKGIFFLLMIKCDILSKDIGEPKGSAVLKYR